MITGGGTHNTYLISCIEKQLSTIGIQIFIPEKTVIDYVNSKIDFFASDAEFECHEIGDGNLNLVFSVKDTKNNKSIIVKQALPYVRAAGEDWPLDINRGEIETNILKIEYDFSLALIFNSSVVSP